MMNKKNYKRILIVTVVGIMAFSPLTKVLGAQEEPAVETTEETNTDVVLTEEPSNDEVAVMSTPSTTSTVGGTVLSDWTYNDTGSAIVLTKYIGTNMDIVIPSTLNGKEVNIDPGNNLESFFPNNVTSIEIPDVTNKVEYLNESMQRFFQLKTKLTRADLRGLDTTNVKNMMQACASNYSLTELNITGWNTTNVTTMESMFYNTKALKKIEGLETLDTTNVTTMTKMFRECALLETVDLSNFNTANVVDFTDMFDNAKSLEVIDVSNFVTSKATSIAGMFEGCEKLKSLDLTNFDTKNVTDLTRMFNGCKVLEVADVSGFDTSKVTDMAYMFNSCNKLKVIDVSGFNTSKVTSISTMFANCSSVKILDVSNFQIITPLDLRYMFAGCSSLTSLNMANFGTANVVFMKQMFDGVNNIQVFDLSGFDFTKLQENTNGYEKMFDSYATEAVPTLIVANTPKLNVFNTTIKGRTYGGPHYDANGGTFTDSSTKKSYFDHFVFADRSQFSATKDDIKNKYTPTNGGATFTGWYTDADCTVAFTGTGNVDLSTAEYLNLKLYAGWEREVTFDSNGGSAVTSQNVNAGNLATKPSDPTKTGVSFMGWYKDAACTTLWDFDNDKVTTDITLYAGWAHSVTYDSNNGTTAVSEKVKAGSFLTKPTDPIKTGYTFDGWYKEADLNTEWDFGADKVNKNIKLYAKWAKNEYTVTFDAAGGQSNTPSKKIVYDEAYGSLPVPVKAGATFKGWFTQSAGAGEKREASDIVKVAGNETLYAYWVKDYFEIQQGNIKFHDKQDERYNLKIDEVNRDIIKDKKGLQSSYDIYFLLNDSRVSIKDKKMTVTIKLKDNEIGFKYYKVAYINAAGDIVEEYIPNLVKTKDALQFEVDHLSIYAVYAWNDDGESSVTPNQGNINKNPDTGDHTGSYVSWYVALVFLSLSVAVLVYKKLDKIRK